MYYSSAQQLAHHASSGYAMCNGDLLGSCTVSGETEDSCGSLPELTSNGKGPLTLPGGATRTFLEDGDGVTLRGVCERDDVARIGFGACAGTIRPAMSGS